VEIEKSIGRSEMKSIQSQRFDQETMDILDDYIKDHSNNKMIIEEIST